MNFIQNKHFVVNIFKNRNIRNLIRLERLDFVAIQETKRENITEGLCHFLWGISEVG